MRFFRLIAIAFAIVSTLNSYGQADIQNSTAPAATSISKPVPVESEYVVGAYYWISWDTHKVLTHFMDWNDSMFQPLLGQYNSTDTAVIDQHIKWAVENGISFFAVQFYETQLKEGFLKADFLPYIKFAFIAPIELSVSEDSEKMVHQIEWMSKYFDRQQYLRINGKPVVFILIRYANSNLTPQEEGRLLDRIKDTKAFAQKTGQNLYLVGVYSIGDGRFDRTSQKISQEFDAITVYNMPEAGGKSTSYNIMVSTYKLQTNSWSQKAKATNISFIPTVIPGFDDSLSFQHRTRDWLVTRPGSTPKKFQTMCEAIKPYIDPNNKILMITAWNEFAEGSVIEPTKEFGFSYLEVIKQTFATQR